MLLADAITAVFYFYALLFTITLLVLFAGIRMMYLAYQTKNENGMRRAKFLMLFAVVAMLCIAVVSFFITGKLPVS